MEPFQVALVEELGRPEAAQDPNGRRSGSARLFRFVTGHHSASGTGRRLPQCHCLPRLPNRSIAQHSVHISRQYATAYRRI